MKKNWPITLNAVLILMVVMAAGFTTAAAQKKKKIVYYAIPVNTTIRVRIERELNSKTEKVGNTFWNTTVDPIYSSGGVLLIPQGSKIHGRINNAIPAKKDGKPGTIDVGFNSISFPNKRTAAISGTLTSLDGDTKSDNEGTASGKKTAHRNAKFIGGGAAGGALIGAIAGGGKGAAIGAGVGLVGGFIAKKVKKGDEAKVKSGTEFGVILNRGISLPKY